MEKEQYRSVIRFLFLDGKNCDEIKTKLDAVSGDISPSMTTVRFWFIEFKCERTSVSDEDQPGRPAHVVTEDIVKKVRKIILADRRTIVREVAEAVGDQSRIEHMLVIPHDLRGQKHAKTICPCAAK